MSDSAAQPTQPQAAPAHRKYLWGACVATAWIAALFCLTITALLLTQYFSLQSEAPLKSPSLELLKSKLAENPAVASVKEEFRTTDLRLRQSYFQHLKQTSSGAWLLLAGLIVFVLAAKQAAALRRPLPMPQPKPETGSPEPQAPFLARWAVTIAGLTITTVLLSVAIGARSSLPAQLAEWKTNSAAQAAPQTPAQPAGPTAEEIIANWPRFRGPGGNGVVLSSATNFPLSWDAASGTGIAWKVPVPAKGFGSPILWNNRLFLSGGNASKRQVFCFDTGNGSLLWQQDVPPKPLGPDEETPEIPAMTGYAAATPATDGQRVYAFFATGDLAAFNLDGQPLWTKHLGPLENPYGHASSLATWQTQLFLQLDQGEADDTLSKLIAFDGATGQILWQKTRKVPGSWASPIIIPGPDQPRIITLTDPWVIANRISDGQELWRAECLFGEITPSPVFADGLLFVASPTDKLSAIKTDGTGDVTKTHIAWQAEDGIPDVTSPVSNGKLVFVVDTPGMLTCYDAKNGDKIWEQDLALDCQASPSIAGDRLYIFTKPGTTIVARAGRQFEELARNELGEQVFASPAFAQNQIFVRGLTNLFCLAQPQSPAAQTASSHDQP